MLISALHTLRICIHYSLQNIDYTRNAATVIPSLEFKYFGMYIHVMKTRLNKFRISNHQLLHNWYKRLDIQEVYKRAEPR